MVRVLSKRYGLVISITSTSLSSKMVLIKGGIDIIVFFLNEFVKKFSTNTDRFQHLNFQLRVCL